VPEVCQTAGLIMTQKPRWLRHLLGYEQDGFYFHRSFRLHVREDVRVNIQSEGGKSNSRVGLRGQFLRSATLRTVHFVPRKRNGIEERSSSHIDFWLDFALFRFPNKFDSRVESHAHWEQNAREFAPQSIRLLTLRLVMNRKSRRGQGSNFGMNGQVGGE